MRCSSCGAENSAGRKFCGDCGAALARVCSACGAANEASVRFCGECGEPLTPAAQAPSRPPEPATERRLVSVLFADLVGFTTMSESRDAEAVRDLLSRYFETCRRLIELYGGTVEKFIGDAVMAVWGTPVATEDDAERAVRAALDLTAAVSALGDELDAPGLRARAGVLTGEAVVNLDAQGQGMVAGDLVNTASRIQSVAPAGQVYVGEATVRATEHAIAFDDAGEHALKGKAEPVRLWRAVRVVAGVRGSMRSAALEAPFVGRERELRMVKELFHVAAEAQRAQLLSVVGVAGIGKSRLAWEFEKYIDGLAGDAWWHRGRCLSYGEGVAYWALAEMVRMRCGIVEDDEPATALAKLRETIAEHIPPEEQSFVEPRLAHLLGLGDGAAGDQENLFSAWRILFERLAERAPTVLVFEDMQWADEGLLDFLEYLLEWSRNQPLFVLTLARPELAERRASWGLGKRSFTSLYLEPLPAAAMEELMSGLVPGLPEEIRRRILERAEGVPLYAVETVRMLVGKGLLVREAGTFRPAGEIDTLDVPETLHALVAARLDGLSPDERRLVQDAAVLGKTFTLQGLAALTGKESAELEPLLASLLRKEVLSIQADPRSPERGQYTFLQDIIKQVAYDTLSKRERKARHLAAARFLEAAWRAGEEDVVEVVAAHYLDAYRAEPEDDDAVAIRAKACELIIRAGDRAASLAATAEAQRAYEQAIELSADDESRAGLHERAGLMAHIGLRPDPAAAHFERAIALYEALGLPNPAARVSARLAEILWDRGRLEQGLETMDSSYEVLAQGEPDADLAALAAQLGRFLFFSGDRERAVLRIEAALAIAEALDLPEVLSQALNTKAVILLSQGRRREAHALLRFALDVALREDKQAAAIRAYYNLSDILAHADEYAEAEAAVRDGLALARRVGNRYWEMVFLVQSYALFAQGKWDEELALFAEMRAQVPEEQWRMSRQAYATAVGGETLVLVHRGQLDAAARTLTNLASLAESADVQERAGYGLGKSVYLHATGEHEAAHELALDVFGRRDELALTHESVKEAWVVAVDAAFALSDLARVRELLALLEAMPAGAVTPFFRAHAARFRARLAARGDGDDPAVSFEAAATLFGTIGCRFYAAVTALEHGEWLAERGPRDEAEARVAEARDTFAELGASPWLARADAALSHGRAEIRA